MIGFVMWGLFCFGLGWLFSEGHMSYERRRVKRETEFRVLNRRVR